MAVAAIETIAWEPIVTQSTVCIGPSSDSINPFQPEDITVVNPKEYQLDTIEVGRQSGIGFQLLIANNIVDILRERVICGLDYAGQNNRKVWPVLLQTPQKKTEKIRRNAKFMYTVKPERIPNLQIHPQAELIAAALNHGAIFFWCNLGCKAEEVINRYIPIDRIAIGLKDMRIRR
jgi:hypothetical protein